MNMGTITLSKRESSPGFFFMYTARVRNSLSVSLGFLVTIISKMCRQNCDGHEFFGTQDGKQARHGRRLEQFILAGG